MAKRLLGRSGLRVSPIGFGAFKIGRNQGAKYGKAYDLPDEPAVARLLNAVLDMGINYIDTAPAYGVSEARIGAALAHRRDEFVLSTKVGETFEDGRSTYDFSAEAVRESIRRSLERLRTDVLDVVFIHSDGRDLHVMEQTDVVPVLLEFRDKGLIKAVGLSGKTAQGARAALRWADAIMVEYNLNDPSHAAVIAEAAGVGVGVVVKKGLASGQLDASDAVRFVLANPAVASMVVGSLNVEHLKHNLTAAEEGRKTNDE